MRFQGSGFSRIVTCSHLRYAVLHFLKCLDARQRSDPRIFVANQSQSWPLAARGSEARYFGGAIISQTQPARKQRPPNGVIAPSQRRFDSAIT